MSADEFKARVSREVAGLFLDAGAPVPLRADARVGEAPRVLSDWMYENGLPEQEALRAILAVGQARRCDQLGAWAAAAAAPHPGDDLPFTQRIPRLHSLADPSHMSRSVYIATRTYNLLAKYPRGMPVDAARERRPLLTLGDLRNTPPGELLHLNGIGPGSIAALQDVLRAAGVTRGLIFGPRT